MIYQLHVKLPVRYLDRTSSKFSPFSIITSFVEKSATAQVEDYSLIFTNKVLFRYDNITEYK